LKKLRKTFVGFIASAAILAVIASPASALKWSTEGGWSGTLTFTKEGGKFPSKCTFSKQALHNFFGLDLENEFLWGGWVTSGSCSEGGAATWYPRFEYLKEISSGKYEFRFYDSLVEAHQSPWSKKNWWGDETGEGRVTLINGNATEHSRLVFNGTYVNYVEGFPFEAKASGTLTADGTQKLE